MIVMFSRRGESFDGVNNSVMIAVRWCVAEERRGFDTSLFQELSSSEEDEEENTKPAKRKRKRKAAIKEDDAGNDDDDGVEKENEMRKQTRRKKGGDPKKKRGRPAKRRIGTMGGCLHNPMGHRPLGLTKKE